VAVRRIHRRSALGTAGFPNAGIGATFVGSNGNVFVGTTFSTARTATPGFRSSTVRRALAWGPTTFLGVADGYAHFWDLTASPDGSVVVTGAAQEPDGTGAWATLKYDRTTGSVLWVRCSSRPG
jgi:hypothetical protein